MDHCWCAYVPGKAGGKTWRGSGSSQRIDLLGHHSSQNHSCCCSLHGTALELSVLGFQQRLLRQRPRHVALAVFCNHHSGGPVRLLRGMQPRSLQRSWTALLHGLPLCLAKMASYRLVTSRHIKTGLFERCLSERLPQRFRNSHSSLSIL